MHENFARVDQLHRRSYSRVVGEFIRPYANTSNTPSVEIQFLTLMKKNYERERERSFRINTDCVCMCVRVKLRVSIMRDLLK